MSYQSIYNNFQDIKSILDYRLLFPAWNTNATNPWKCSDIGVYICQKNQNNGDPIPVPVSGLKAVLLGTTYNAQPIDRLVINLEISKGTDPSLKFEYSNKITAIGNEVALLGLSTNSPSNFSTEEKPKKLFEFYCTNKPAKIIYSETNWKDGHSLSQAFNNNVAFVVQGNDKDHNFNTQKWLFAEYLDWILPSLKGICLRFSPDNVANWILNQLSIIA